jgi:hypothetical protein
MGEILAVGQSGKQLLSSSIIGFQNFPAPSPAIKTELDPASKNLGNNKEI